MSNNPFLSTSMEENTLDANDNNPLLKAEDPAKVAEEDGAKLADDYEYVEAEAVEGENQKAEEAIITETIKDTTTDINNIVKEADRTSDTLNAVASVAAEMYAITSKTGKLSPCDMFVVQKHLSSMECATLWVDKDAVAMPSMESFKTPGLQYTQSQVAMESVVGLVFRGIERLSGLILKIIELGIGAAAKYLKNTNSRLERAQNLLSSIDGSHREAGLKEVSGGFVKGLMVDGKTPDATTVLKTAAYTNVVAKEFLSEAVYKQIEQTTSVACTAIFDKVNFADNPQPSGLLTSAFIAFGFMAASGGSALAVLPVFKIISDSVKTQRNFKIDPSVTPQIFKLFPNISKLNYSGEEVDGMYDCKRSLPLFGNRTLYAYQLASTVKPQSLRTGNTPTVVLVNEGGDKGAATSIQALTSSQQKDALTSAIAMLTTAKEYYNAYPTRVNSLQRVNKEGIAKGKVLQKQGDNVGRQWAGALQASTLAAIYRMYWRGLVSDQGIFAAHLIKTADHLIALVEASSTAAKANVKGSASQEAIAVAEEVKNPFM